MGIKAIFMDMDGTLLRSDRTLSEKLKQKLKELSDKGVKICIATGRMFKASKKYIDYIEGVKEPTIHYNGGMIVDPNTGEILYEKAINPELVKKIIDISRQSKVHLNLYYKDEMYIDSESEEGLIYAKRSGVPYIVENFENYKGKTSTKGLFIGENTRLVELKKELEEKIDELNYVFSSPSYLEVLPKVSNKGLGVLEMLKRFGLTTDEAMAFGDQWNDLEMLKTVKYGYLMGNADEKLKEKFSHDRITLTNDEDGILYILNKYFE